MVKSTINVITKSKKMGRPVTTGKGELIGVRILPDLMAALDKHVADTEAASRPDAIRAIVSAHLKRKGLL
jgi:hypothetical protein